MSTQHTSPVLSKRDPDEIQEQAQHSHWLAAVAEATAVDTEIQSTARLAAAEIDAAYRSPGGAPAAARRLRELTEANPRSAPAILTAAMPTLDRALSDLRVAMPEGGVSLEAPPIPNVTDPRSPDPRRGAVVDIDIPLAAEDVNANGAYLSQYLETPASERTSLWMNAMGDLAASCDTAILQHGGRDAVDGLAKRLVGDEPGKVVSASMQDAAELSIRGGNGLSLWVATANRLQEDGRPVELELMNGTLQRGFAGLTDSFARISRTFAEASDKRDPIANLFDRIGRAALLDPTKYNMGVYIDVLNSRESLLPIYDTVPRYGQIVGIYSPDLAHATTTPGSFDKAVGSLAALTISPDYRALAQLDRVSIAGLDDEAAAELFDRQ
ncbi:hypothetical protein [Inquilinus sp. OTU3971]|uniref:hypothetical protein n=1 Tax=Inquilinus sp. OTU3971 TaxID=3043855 RepID=UPI00313B7844